MGLYYTNPKQPNKKLLRASKDKIRKIYPIKKDAELFFLKESPDGENLLFLTEESGKLCFSVIDKLDGTLRQKLFFKHHKGFQWQDPDTTDMITTKDDALLISSKEFLFLTKEKGSYKLAAAGDFPQSITFGWDNYFTYDYDGKEFALLRLASGPVDDSECELTLYHCTDGRLDYTGRIHTTLYTRCSSENRISQPMLDIPIAVTLKEK